MRGVKENMKWTIGGAMKKDNAKRAEAMIKGFDEFAALTDEEKQELIGKTIEHILTLEVKK